MLILNKQSADLLLYNTMFFLHIINFIQINFHESMLIYLI